MKFLLLVKPRTAPQLPENPISLYQGSKEYLNAMLANGKLECVYNFASGRGFVAIANAESHEELWTNLTTYPLMPYRDVEVHPLADMDYVHDKAIERARKKMGASSPQR